MNPSPTANRSFLHGSRGKAALISDKVVYATLDSLALKRARLPLQLLPADNENIDERTEKENKERRSAPGKISPNKRPTCKVKSGASHQWKNYSKYLAYSSAGLENQPTGVAERDIASIPEEENHARAAATEDSTKASPSLSRDKSCAKDLRNSDDSMTEVERISRDVVGDQREKEERCSVARSNSDSSDGYERMNVTDSRVLAVEKTSIATDRDVLNVSASESTRIGKSTPIAARIAVKSKSVNDLATGEVTCENAIDDEDSSIWKKKKKKKRFTRNVLHYVPRHLMQQPKKKKKKLKKRHILSSSLSSLRSLQTTPVSRSAEDARDGTRRLSREELRSVTISSPTNFIHVASATNSLIANENTIKSGVGQLVITHQQKCATLTLLVGKDERRAVGNGNTVWSKVNVETSPVDDTNFNQPEPAAVVKNAAGRSDRTNYVEIKSVRSKDDDDSPSQTAKVLEADQLTKNAIGSRVANPSAAMYEPIYKYSSQQMPRANSSFLWSKHQTKTLPSDERDARAAQESGEDTDSEGYDNVGPSNFAAQADSNYDDVDPPAVREAETIADTTEDCEEIYDDVMPPSFMRETADPRLVDEKNDYLIPEVSEGAPAVECQHVELRTVAKDRAETSCQMPSDDRYLATNNEYSSVDENRLDEEERDELDVYDDVGLPTGEERANSLYAGSAPGSVLGTVSMNGKESEWEDLEEILSASHYSCQRSDPCGKGIEGQVVSAKKRFAARWSRKTRMQRSGKFRRGIKPATQATPVDVNVIAVAVSLGGGSILLIGGHDAIAGERKGSTCQRDDHLSACRTQGLVQLRVVNLDEDLDTQETCCYVHEESGSDDSTYESLYSCQPDDFSSDSDAETSDARQQRQQRHDANEDGRANSAYQGCPTRPTPPPPREASLTQTLGRRIKMLRRTWSITKGSLGRIRRRTSVDECFDDNKEPANDHHHHYHHIDASKYFNFRRHFRKSIASPPTFYLDNENMKNDIDSTRDNNNGVAKEAFYTNSQYLGSGSDDSSRSTAVDIDHYSVLADQEPLYQFYAAAVARVAFESDSEGYEEVEDVMWKTGPAATDLARLGQRMLWCHTPQVIHSGLLQRLTPEEKKIQEAKFEVLTSEASYLNSLRVLENEFLNDHALMNEILTSIESKRLFGDVPGVLSASRLFLAELEAVWREDLMLSGLSNVLLKHAEKCQDTYVAYCSNQVSIDTTLKELRVRKGVKFLEIVKRIETRPACQNLSLHSFLMLPMQRVTRLPLLADAVLSKLSMGNSERASWEKVLSTLSNIVAECNEGARTAAQEAEMEALARKLEYSTKIKPIMLRGKELVRSGSVVQLSTKTDTEYKLTFGKKFNKTPLYLLLLTDYLLVTRLKSNAQDESYTVIDACKRNLLALESASEESPFAGRNAMILTLLENHSGRHVEYVLTCENNTERERWLEAVSPPKRGLVGETLYESWDCPQVMAKYPYLPNQPDELSLQPGDIINVLKKMADGWYHGEKLVDSEQGWFPANHTKEVASEHVRARNLKQRHRLLALSSSVIQQRRAKQNQGAH